MSEIRKYLIALTWRTPTGFGPDYPIQKQVLAFTAEDAVFQIKTKFKAEHGEQVYVNIISVDPLS